MQDLPFRLDQAGGNNDFLYEALKFNNAFTSQIDNASNPGNYLLVGDHVGTIAIQSVVVMSPPGDEWQAGVGDDHAQFLCAAAGRSLHAHDPRQPGRPGRQQAGRRIECQRAAGRAVVPQRRRRAGRQLCGPLHDRFPAGDRHVRVAGDQHRHQRQLRLGPGQRTNRQRRHQRRPVVHAAGVRERQRDRRQPEPARAAGGREVPRRSTSK